VIRVGADRHVVLIGLPGAGKTSIGRRLAKVLRRPFADADEQLELTIGSTIPRVVREGGEAELRRLESQTLRDLLSRFSPLVVSAPGGAQIEDEHRASLARSATVFWIRGSVRFLAELSDPTYRPRLDDSHEVALTRLERELSTHYAEIADHIVDIEPFHSLDLEPKHAIARHIVELPGAGDLRGSDAVPTGSQLPLDGNEAASAQLESDLVAHYAEIADHIVDVEPFRSIDGDAKRALVRRIIELLDLGETSNKSPQ
jgi:shikimate kinase